MTQELRNDLSTVDRLIHEPARLMIMTILNAVDEADFLYLLNETGLTRGNLSTHLSKLEDAGYIKIEKDGIHQFYLTSDDGSKLAIDGEIVVLNDGQHAMVEASGSVFLKKGYHAIDLSFFQAGGGSGLQLMIQSPGKEKEVVDGNTLFHLNEK